MQDDVDSILHEFYQTDFGVHIPEPHILVWLGKIPHTINHPHQGYDIYASRRALKHIIERRKQDLLKRHTNDECFLIIRFLLNSILESILTFDEYIYEKPCNHFYVKDFTQSQYPKVRILAEVAATQLHIKSVHLVKRTKKHHTSGDF